MNSYDQQDEREKRILKHIDKLRAVGFNYEELLRHAAEGWDWADFMESVCEQQQEILDMQQTGLELASALKDKTQNIQKAYADSLDLCIEAIQKTRRGLPGLVVRETEKRRSELAKKAVSEREDQQLKPDWIAHCTEVKKSGINIDRLDDLLNIDGYDPKITSISPRRLKAWAKEAGITLKAGRPKK